MEKSKLETIYEKLFCSAIEADKVEYAINELWNFFQQDANLQKDDILIGFGDGNTLSEIAIDYFEKVVCSVREALGIVKEELEQND